MKTFLLIFLSIIPITAQCAYRPVDIEKELKSASFIGEILFVGYDSVQVPRYSDGFFASEKDSLTDEYKRLKNSDSVWIISKIYFKKRSAENDSICSAEVNSFYSWVQYSIKPDSLPKKRISNGFWPKMNETCLLVLDLESKVSLFAALEDDSYIFWDPYPNSSNNTIFVFDEFFEPFPKDGKNSTTAPPLKSNAQFYKREHASQFHCSIKKHLLWNEIIANK